MKNNPMDVFAQMDAMMAHLFRDITGKWPPSGFTPETAPDVEPTRNTLNKIKALRIAFLNRRTAA